jgi:hypothetical protein
MVKIQYIVTCDKCGATMDNFMVEARHVKRWKKEGMTDGNCFSCQRGV